MNATYFARPNARVAGSEPSKYRNLLTILALLLVVSAPGWLYLLFFASEQFDYSSSLLEVPPVLIIHGVLVGIASRRDGFLRRVMLVGSLAKVAAASVFLFMAFHVYNESVDALHYFDQGQVYIAAMEANRGFLLLQPFWSNNFIYMISGLLQSVVGYDLQTTTVIFALISFWGQYFCYRAFRTALPFEDSRLGALLLFLLPSLVFWSAPIGKDSIMLLFIGLTAYGVANLARQIVLTGCIAGAAGIAGVAVIRPHVALMIAAAYALPFLLARTRGAAGMVIKIFGLPVLAAITLYLAISAQSFLQMEDVSQGQAVLQRVGSNSNYGGSAFGRGAGSGQRILAAPLLFFRPFPWEARNGQSAIAALEGLFLAFLVWKRRQQFVLLVKHWRENPFIFFALAFVVEFSIIFSAAISNFGLLARQRVMALPFFIILLCARNLRERAGTVRAPLPPVYGAAQPARNVALPVQGP